MLSSIKITNVHMYLASGHFQKPYSKILFPIRIYWKVEDTPLSACSPRLHNAPKASNCKEATYALEWLTARSIILTEQMGGKLNIQTNSLHTYVVKVNCELG